MSKTKRSTEQQAFLDELAGLWPLAKGSLTDVALTMQKHLAASSQKFSHIYPLSVLPIIDFMIRKKIEVDNIRIIARGKESGLDVDHIKDLLVV